MRTRAHGPSTVIVTIALFTAVLALPEPGGAATAPSRSSASPISFAGGAKAWTPSGNARVTTTRSAATSIVQVRPKRTRGHKTISMKSAPSAGAIAAVGTKVSASARLRTSQPGRRLTLRILEVNRGRVVASRSTTVKPSSSRWRHVAVSLRTTRAGSRIQLVTQAKRLRGRHVVRLTSLSVSTTTTPAAVVGATPAAAACEDIDYADPAQGARTFTEEFGGTQPDGTGIDRATWRVRDSTFLNQDKAWITKDAVTVHDGYLDIAGRRLPQNQWLNNAHALYPGVNTVRDYSTGYIDTIDSAGYGNAAGDRFGQKYGRFEMRAWVPSEQTMSRGIWPAFWLRADNRAGEIDPMESYGAPTIRSFDPSSSYEWNSWADTAQGATNDANKQITQGRANVGTDKIWQGWHTYGVNWSPGCLRYLYDGRTVGLVEFDAPGTKAYFRGPTFDDTFHLRLNMQIGSNYWGWADPSHTRPEFHYKVDWVRVYQGNELLGR